MMEQNTLQTMLQCYSGLKIIIGKELCIKLKFWPGGGGRDEVWDRETMFSQLAKRSPSVVVSG